MVNVTRMIELVRQNPGIRTVQLSDRLDCSIEELQATIGAERERGSAIVSHQVIAPNGHNTTAYTMLGVPLPEPDAAQVAKLTIVERAIDIIRAQPTQQASGAYLHSALGLRETDVPSKILAAGLNDGRLLKDGKWWTVGADVAPLTAGVDVQADRIEVLTAEPAAPVVRTSTEVIAARTPRGKTKIQTVIDYLEENGKTDTHTLRGVLGIVGRSLHPLSYLQDALSDGRIERSGNLWWAPGCEYVKHPPIAEIPRFVPETTPAVSENPPIVAESEPSVPEITPPVADVKPEVQTTILDRHSKYVETEMVAAAVHAMASEVQTTICDDEDYVLNEERKATDFACALWSDGELQLVRDGSTVARLTLEEALHLSKYLKRTSLELA